MIVDFHTHIYPEAYIAEMKKRSSGFYVTGDTSGNLTINLPGRAFQLVRPYYRIDERLREMEKLGIDKQIISQSGPWTDIFELSLSVEMSRKVNESIAEIAENYPDKFVGMATLPMQDPAKAAEELSHAAELGLKGVIIATNIRGKYLDDPSYHPLLERCEKLGMAIFLHPIDPNDAKSWFPQDFGLTVSLTFPLETTIGLARLVLAGVLEKYPGLKIVAAHAGGTIPYIAGRLDRAYEVMPGSKGKIEKPPTHYLKKLYVDTICFRKDTLRYAMEFFGADHVLFGSDYPFPWGVEAAKSTVKDLNLEKRQEEQIFSGNVQKLLHI